MTDTDRNTHEIAGADHGRKAAHNALLLARMMYDEDHDLRVRWLMGFAAGVSQYLDSANVPGPEIFIALNDEMTKSGGTFVAGAFSSEERAQEACQENADTTEPLVWKDAEATDTDGSVYTVMLVDLDVPV